MKKTLYLAVCMVVAGTCSMWSSPRHTIVPGFGEYEPRPSIQVQTEKAPTGATLTTKTPPRLVMKEEATHEEDRLIKYTSQYGENEPNVTTYGYDRYGFLAYEDLGGLVLNTEYHWAIPGKAWDRKTRTNASTSALEDENVRTFHSNGMVETEDYKSSYASYHVEYDTEGYAVYSIQYDESNQMKTEHRWKRFTPKGSDRFTWLEESTEAKNFRTSYTIGETDNYTIYHRENFDGSDWVKSYDLYEFFNVNGYFCGSWNINYENGEAVPGFGTLSNFEVPGDGSYFVISGMNSYGEWNITKKTEYSDSYRNLTDPVRHPDECWTIEYYQQTVDGKMQLLPTLKTTYTYFKGNFVRAESTNLIYGGTSSTSYYLLDADTHTLNGITYDETTGNYAIVTQVDGITADYSYRDSEGMEFKRLRVINEDNGLQTWLVWTGDNWAKLTGTLELMDYTCVFDNEGRVTSYTMLDENNQVKFKYEVAYDDKGGFTRNEYRRPGGGELRLSSKLVYDAVEDKSVRDSYVYDGAGVMKRGNRTVTDHKAGIYDYYEYDYDTDTWKHTGCTIRDLVEKMPDGSEVTIKRTIDLEHNIVPQTKIVVNPGLNRVVTYYYWVAALEEWVPNLKEVRERYPAAGFEYHMPVEPTILYNDYFEPKYHGVDPNIVTYPETNLISYIWDTDKNDWILNYSVEPFSKVEDNTLSILYNYDGYNNVTSYTVDDSRNVIRYSSYNVYPDGRTEPEMDIEYSYDAKGHLTRRHSDFAGWTSTEEFTYGPVTIYSGIDDVAAEESEDAAYTVYNLQGILLLREAGADAVKALPEGLYLINGKKAYLRH